MTGTFVSSPTFTPRPTGLLRTASVVNTTNDNEFYGGTEHEPAVCGMASSIPDACFDVYLVASYENDTAPDEDTLTLTLVGYDDDVTYSVSIDGDSAANFTNGVYEVTVDSASSEEAVPYVIFADGTAIWEGTLSYPTDDGIIYDGAIKEFQGYGSVHGTPFALYKGIECFLNDPESNAERARLALEASESHGVERHFWNNILAAEAIDVTPTPGSSVSVVDGVRILEDVAGNSYPGLGLIHMGLGAALFARGEDAIYGHGADLHTAVGTPVVAGSGYISKFGPGGRQASDGEAWVYFSGPVQVRRSSIVLIEVPNQTENLKRGLAERKYIATFDCIALAVLVQID